MKRKYIICLLIFVLVIILIIITFVFNLRKKEKRISLIDDYVIIEYGENYSPSINDLIDLSKYDFINKDEIEIKNNIKNEQGKEYPSVGTYKIVLNYKNSVLTQTIIVKDTIAPKISINEKIEIPIGTDLKNFDFKQFAKIEDLSDTKDLKLNYENIDINTGGEYIAKIIVSDIYSNTSEKEFTIIVQEAKEESNTNIIEESNESIIEDTNEEKMNINNKIQKQKQEQKYNIQNEQEQVQETQQKEQIVYNEQQETSELSQENNIQEDNQTKEQVYETLPPVQEKQEEKKYCVEGGPIHLEGDGEGEHGYYESWDEAFDAMNSYTAGWETFNYKIAQCPCGKFYFKVTK